MAAIEVNEENFDKVVLGSDVPVMVDFFAKWCAPCKALSPIIEEIADQNDGGYKVCKIDIDESRKLAEKYGVMSIPTIMIFKDGEIKSTRSGLQKKEDLMQML